MTRVLVNFFVILILFSCAESSNFETGESVKNFFYDAKLIFENRYGICDRDILFRPEMGKISCAGFDNAAGCARRSENFCEISVRIDVDRNKLGYYLLHELYHCCKGVSEHGEWCDELERYAQGKF